MLTDTSPTYLKSLVPQLLEQPELFSASELSTVLVVASDLYYNEGESFLTDAEYDALERVLRDIDPANIFFTGIGSEVRGGKIKLPYQMGSLTQAYEGDIVKWINKYKLQHELLVITDKLDGTSALLLYGNNGELRIAYSRGDGVEGADITRHLQKIPSVPKTVRTKNLVVRGEIIIPKAKFTEAQTVCKSRSGQPYKNPRNAVAGLMNAEKNVASVYNYINFIAYEILENGNYKNKALMLDELSTQGFLTPAWSSFKGNEINDDVLTLYLNNHRQKSDYEIDGIVIDVNDEELRKSINPTKDTLNPEYARKFKVADASNLAIATVVEVEWNVSKDGYLKPRVRVEPIELVGVTIQHATGFNAKFIKEKGIGPGAKVKITRSGDVIPFIFEVVKSVTPQLPTEKQYGKMEWTNTSVDLVLVETNDTMLHEQLIDFFATIDAPHLREGNLLKLFESGYKTPESIITMDVIDMVMVLGNAIGGKAFDGLREKLTNIPMYTLMGALPAFGRGVGVRKMKKLYEAFDGDMSHCQNIADIIAVDGFDEKTAVKISEGFPAFCVFMTNVKDYVTVAPYVAKPKGGLTGQKIVFTGFRDSDLEKQIEALGGEMQSGVSGKTTILVAANPNSGSTKLKKAQEKGIRVIGIEQLKEML